jgi:hypothetical protein
MTEDTKKALMSVTAKALDLHRECRNPEEDCCGDLSDWIVETFGLRDQELGAYSATRPPPPEVAER